MRLLTRVNKAERRSAEKTQRKPEGVVWSEHVSRVDCDKLRAGEHVACDVEFTGEIGDVEQVRVSERVTKEEGDHGGVYREGKQIGDVQKLEGGRLEYLVYEQAEGASAGAKRVRRR